MMRLRSRPNELLDVAALTEDRPEQDLRRRQVGTIVEILSGNAFEVEFSDDQGIACSSIAVPADRLVSLHYRPEGETA